MKPYSSWGVYDPEYVQSVEKMLDMMCGEPRQFLPIDNPDSEEHDRYHRALNRIAGAFLVALMVFLSGTMPENFQGFSWFGPSMFCAFALGWFTTGFAWDRIIGYIVNLIDYFRGY